MKYYELFRRFNKYSSAVEKQRGGLTVRVESLFHQIKVISINTNITLLIAIRSRILLVLDLSHLFAYLPAVTWLKYYFNSNSFEHSLHL